ncbi:DUF3298 and DUF4163 domain-containing protein [Brevibacillus sp. TJ4]|uniref:DUF3298 and DUF4163 domain-containing protein n=1 Tax=Brevibacillus sp. TJ4 TaxID=3234853 RepID=UPI0037D4AB40
MKAEKWIAVSLLSTSLLFTGIITPVSASAELPLQAASENTGITITSQSMNSSAAEYEARISYPQISGLADKAFEAQLNAELQKYAADSLANVQKESKQAAIAARQQGYEFRPYVLDISYKVYNTGKLLSFSVSHYEYTGGAHGMTSETYYNVANLDKGRKLELSDLFQPGYDYRTVLSNLIKQQIAVREQQEGNLGYWFEGISANQAFSIQDGNLVIHFGQYEIAPYAAGMPSFTIPKKQYANLLKPEIRALLQ